MMHSHFISYLGLCSTEEDQIYNGATLHVAYPILSIPCLLMLWWREEPGHHQEWYWPNKPEYSISSTRRVKYLVTYDRNQLYQIRSVWIYKYVTFLLFSMLMTVAYSQIGARSSATTLLTQLWLVLCCMNDIAQNICFFTLAYNH